jgi:4-methylaminobutanoate oxidase (formaldehyde-forming)
MDEFKKIASLGRSYGIEIEPISPGEAGEMWPMMRIDDLVGGLYIPQDAQMVPHLAASALARGAEMGGATLIENVSVTGVRHEGGAVTGVSTDRGDVACEYVVNAAGMWSRALGTSAGVKVPLMAAEHMYLGCVDIFSVAK